MRTIDECIAQVNIEHETKYFECTLSIEETLSLIEEIERLREIVSMYRANELEEGSTND